MPIDWSHFLQIFQGVLWAMWNGLVLPIVRGLIIPALDVPDEAKITIAALAIVFLTAKLMRKRILEFIDGLRR